MAADMGTGDGGEVAAAAPQPTHIDVHIHQESALAKLLLSGCSLLRARACPRGADPQTGHLLLVASWVVQIVLGALTGVLGGLLYICGYSELLSSGAAIWTGVVAVLAGALAFIHEKHGGKCWGFLRILFSLAAFSTSVAAIHIWANGYNTPFYRGSYVCGGSSSEWVTQDPSTMKPEEFRRLNLCFSYVSMLQNLFFCLRVMLLSIWITQIVAFLAPLGLCCWRILLPKKEKDRKELLQVGSSPMSI
ncbi:transmembrane protein 176A [Dasypus novemcinctus]|uniref:transmembrane protein 176A n=1 Tax=Dasypus novemcinctus TaxID=9361 RepID=UPI0003291793|nr:transmembrane protein 176A [Dasypus novemcinctus]